MHIVDSIRSDRSHHSNRVLYPQSKKLFTHVITKHWLPGALIILTAPRTRPYKFVNRRWFCYYCAIKCASLQFNTIVHQKNKLVLYYYWYVTAYIMYIDGNLLKCLWKIFNYCVYRVVNNPLDLCWSLPFVLLSYYCHWHNTGLSKLACR